MKGNKVISTIGNSYKRWEYDVAVGLMAGVTMMAYLQGDNESGSYLAVATGLSASAPVIHNASGPVLKTYDFFKGKLKK